MPRTVIHLSNGGYVCRALSLHPHRTRPEGREVPMNLHHLDLDDSHLESSLLDEPQQGVPTTREVLAELFQLLEDYAPTWYTETHHNRVVAALLGRPV
jgi:hypothetical protein